MYTYLVTEFHFHGVLGGSGRVTLLLLNPAAGHVERFIEGRSTPRLASTLRAPHVLIRALLVSTIELRRHLCHLNHTDALLAVHPGPACRRSGRQADDEIVAPVFLCEPAI